VEKATSRVTSAGRRSVAWAASSSAVGWLNTIAGGLLVADVIEKLLSGTLAR